MAIRKTRAAGENEATAKTSHLPEGFESAKADRAEYFAKPSAGLIINGQLLGRYPKRGQYPGFYYQIRAFKPVAGCEHKVGPQEYETDAICPAGEIVSIDEKGGLKCLESLADGSREVYIYCGAKRDIGNNQTAWEFEVGHKAYDSDNAPF